MKRWIVLLALLPLACAPESPLLVTPQGVGSIRIGMSKAELDKVNPSIDYGSTPQESCVMAQVKDKGLAVLMEEGMVMRIYVRDARYATEKNIRLGSTEQQARQAYGAALTVEPHKYYENGHYLSVIDGAGQGMVFESDGKAIKQLSVGKTPALRYVEGCS